MNGKLIVIDGTDGSGKKTQTKLLVQKLKENNYPVETIDFPQYGTKSAGLAEEYLSGKYGTAEQVGPYIASIFYACDRYDASFKIKEWLKNGRIIICDRYVPANMGHQGGKIEDTAKRDEYLRWLYNLEYSIFNIPKPDLNIILHVPTEIAQKLSQQRTINHNGLNLEKDIHEQDKKHLEQTEATYLYIAKNFPNFKLIECVKNKQLMTREEISNLIWDEIIKIIKK